MTKLQNYIFTRVLCNICMAKIDPSLAESSHDLAVDNHDSAVASQQEHEP